MGERIVCTLFVWGKLLLGCAYCYAPMSVGVKMVKVQLENMRGVLWSEFT